jgi:hypothetical protein
MTLGDGRGMGGRAGTYLGGADEASVAAAL